MKRFNLDRWVLLRVSVCGSNRPHDDAPDLATALSFVDQAFAIRRKRQAHPLMPTVFACRFNVQDIVTGWRHAPCIVTPIPGQAVMAGLARGP